MDWQLDAAEARVLGSLLEKEITTPDYYPLSLNALVNACNQKSNRDPVMTLEEQDVVRALDALRLKQLVLVSADGGRVPKYRHILAEGMQLLAPELALLSELLLRGPQTLGELRTRAERMSPFSDLQAVEEVLRELIEREEPLVTRMARQANRKEARYAQLFSGEPEASAEEKTPPPEAARQRVMAENDRISRIEGELASLREEVAGLRLVVEEFKRQFE